MSDTLDRIDRRLSLLTWLAGLNLAMTAAIVWRVFGC